MSVTEQTRRVIWGLFAGRCAICRKLLIESSETSGKRNVLIGEVAHIVGEKNGAARGESSLTLERRNSSDNLLLLCANHHTEIDSNDSKYNVEFLHKLRKEHLDWIEQNLSREEEVISDFSNIDYINFPRLEQICRAYGYRIDGLNEFIAEDKPLHRYGFRVNYAMNAADKLIARAKPTAVDLTESANISEKSIGRLHFLENKRFRTKNFVRFIKNNEELTGIREKDPYIYTETEGIKIVLAIDPRWVTTKSAAHNFGAGQVHLSCFFLLKDICFETMTAFGSPMIIGTLTAHDFMAMMEKYPRTDSMSFGKRRRLTPDEG